VRCQPYRKGYPWWPAQRLPPSAHDEVPAACPKPSSKSGASDAYQFFGTGEYQWILPNNKKIQIVVGLYKLYAVDPPIARKRLVSTVAPKLTSENQLDHLRYHLRCAKRQSQHWK
jgi:hypothetical protein